MARMKRAASVGRFREAVGGGSLLARRVGMGVHLGDVMAVRPAASMAAACFGIHCASKVARLSVEDVKVDAEAGVADLRANRRQNGQ